MPKKEAMRIGRGGSKFRVCLAGTASNRWAVDSLAALMQEYDFLTIAEHTMDADKAIPDGGVIRVREPFEVGIEATTPCQIYVLVSDQQLLGPRGEQVFGIAFRSTKLDRLVAIVSTYNLEGKAGSRTDTSLIAARVRKEAIHELGHLLGLGHCQFLTCVMRKSPTLLDIDAKPHNYCPLCELEIKTRLDETSVRARLTMAFMRIMRLAALVFRR